MNQVAVAETVKKVASACVQSGLVPEEHREDLEQELDHQMRRNVKVVVAMLMDSLVVPAGK